MSLVLLVANGTLIAASFAAARWLAGREVGPLQLLGWQTLCASVIVSVVAWWCGQAPRWSLVNVRYASVAGGLGITAPGLVSFTVLQRLPAGLVATIAALSPVFTCLLAHAFGLQRPVPRQWLGVALGFAGVALLLLPGTGLPRGEDLPWALLAVLAPLSLAAANLYRTRAWPGALQPMAAASLLLTIQALLLLLAGGLATGSVVLPQGLDRRDAVLLGIGAAAAWVHGTTFVLQRRVGPIAVGQLGNVIPVAGLAIGAVVLGERIPPIAFGAVTIVVAGVYFVAGAPPAAARDAPTVQPAGGSR